MAGHPLETMNINFQTSIKKGDIGERLVADTLGSRGLLTTKWDQDGSHPYDKIMVERKSGKIISLFDVKTKPIRNNYQDTGINLSKYYHYQNSSKINKFPFALFFVDEVRREIYFGFLHELCSKRMCEGQIYPKIERFRESIIYFHISTLKLLCSIATSTSCSIKDQNQRSYLYADVETHTLSLFSKRITEQSEEWLKDPCAKASQK